MQYKKEDLEKFIEEVDGRIGILLLAKARDENGNPFYVYLSIPPEKYPKYIEAQIKGEPVVFAELGKVLKDGPGYPPEEVRREMEEKHGFNHNFEREFIENFLKQMKDVKGVHSWKVGKRRKNYPYAKPEGGIGEWEKLGVGEKKETDNT